MNAHDFGTAVWGLVTGLSWLWTFLAYLAAASVVVSAALVLFLAIHHQLEVRRG